MRWNTSSPRSTAFSRSPRSGPGAVITSRPAILPASQPAIPPITGPDERPDQHRRDVELVLGGDDRRRDQQRLARPGQAGPAGERAERQRHVVDVGRRDVAEDVEMDVDVQREDEQARRSWHTARPTLRAC